MLGLLVVTGALAKQTKTPPLKKPSTVFTMAKVGSTYVIPNPAEMLAKETGDLLLLHRVNEEEHKQLLERLLYSRRVTVLDKDTVVRVVAIGQDTDSPKIKHLFVQVESGEHEGQKGWMSPCSVLRSPDKDWIGCIQNEADNWK